jgi:hypothetical protein
MAGPDSDRSINKTVAGRLLIISYASANPLRLVPKILAIAEGGLGILIDDDDDRLHMMVAITLEWRLAPHLRQRLYPRRIAGLVVVPFDGFVSQSVSLFSGRSLLDGQILQFHTLSRDQRARRRIIEIRALQPANGAGHFGDLRSKFQNPERERIVIHDASSRSLSSRKSTRSACPAGDFSGQGNPNTRLNYGYDL